MNSPLPPFQFATLTPTRTSAGAAAPAAPAAAPADGPIIRWPDFIMQSVLNAQVAAQREFPDDHEMKMEDIEDSDRNRFYLEHKGRCYAAHWPYDRETDVWRNIFYSYPEDVKNGYALPAPDHHSGVFWRDIKRVREEIQMLIAMPARPPTLQRANAEPGY